MNKIKKNDFEIEYSEDFENICKKYYNKNSNELLTNEEIMNYFLNVYTSAVNKGYAEIE